MKNEPSTGTAVAQAAGRELIASALQRNPLVALATAVLSPILGLFRRRPVAAEVEKTKLEHYRSTPVPGLQLGRSKDGAETEQRQSKDAPKRRTVRVRSYVRRAVVVGTSVQEGGVSHG